MMGRVSNRCRDEYATGTLEQFVPSFSLQFMGREISGGRRKRTELASQVPIQLFIRTWRCSGTAPVRLIFILRPLMKFTGFPRRDIAH